MTLPSDDIIRILPGLRRYACALTGSTQVGDEYIRIALETLVEEPWRLPPGSEVKAELYALFHKTLRVCNFREPGAPETLSEGVPTRYRLLQLPLVDRALVLLVDLEGFALSDAAELLGRHEDEAEGQLATARRALQASPRDGRGHRYPRRTGVGRTPKSWIASAAMHAQHRAMTP
jgi:DNA-directed RNA polymerase specialized sigma24 family protein